MKEPGGDQELQVGALIDEIEGLDPGLRRATLGVFQYAKVLLEDPDNLTRVGNLSGVAKEKLHARVLELLGATASSADITSAESEALLDSGDGDSEGEKPA